MMSSQDYIQAATKKWEGVAARTDLAGKQVKYHEGRGDPKAQGKLNKIEVRGGRVYIYCEGSDTPFKHFRIHEENEPQEGNGRIFVDLDDDSCNIQIEL
jgi:uncharacterized Zn-finger protein